MSSLENNLGNRKWLMEQLRAEIVGPDPWGDPIDLLNGGKKAFTWEEFRKPKRQINGEEVLWLDPPSKRYGAGILYPLGVTEQVELASEPDEQGGAIPEGPPSDTAIEEELEKKASGKKRKTKISADDSEDYDVTLTNAFKPSAIGVSFLADLSEEKTGFLVELVNVRRIGSDDVQEQSVSIYRRVPIRVGNSEAGKEPVEKTLWCRTPLVNAEGRFPVVEFSSSELAAGKPIRRSFPDIDPDIMIVAVARRWKSNRSVVCRLITVSLVNRKIHGERGIDGGCIFQAGFRVRGKSGRHWILGYPEVIPSLLNDSDPLSEEKINRLVYRQQRTFAIGHGCAADWQGSSTEAVCEVWTDVLPVFETPSTSADLIVTSADGTKRPIRVNMRKLAGLDPGDDGRGELEALVEAYRDWIGSLRRQRPGIFPIPPDLKTTADSLIARCEECLRRIIDGIRFLAEDSPEARNASKAFMLANHAMLIAQLRSSRDIRIPRETEIGRIGWKPAIYNPDPAVQDPNRGYWRAFQIAFLLMSLRGISLPEDPSRETVDLIWFPTGGGKTEAYLGLTAFTIFYNRLSGNDPGGMDVLMRYTLRLLTAQQFQRAALLFCAMEHLRKKDVKIPGDKSFRIGLWVGGSATPNSRADANWSLKNLQKDSDGENPFVLLKCPWCGAKFGPSAEEGTKGGGRGKYRKRKDQLPSVLGYRLYRKSPKDPETVVFRCDDSDCEFGGNTPRKAPLPIVVIDEDLIEDPPNLLIGTVDKFAMLSWKPEVRSFFGIGSNGRHMGAPPTLIIQDELHLISGPLGSMVGAYETVIEKLCVEDGTGTVKPKIVASTATISRAGEQIKNLFARNDLFLFPPSGLEAGDSFFARDSRNEDGSLKPGRLYVGILAPSHGSMQTTVARTFACLMQHAAVMNTDDAGRDPWWTLLCFFNSLRELGSAATLFVADIREYLRVILNRQGIGYDKIRKLLSVNELTSRIRSDKVPKELEHLEKPFSSTSTLGNEALDACLASSIIEVGVDVSRLSLMAIVGQPKTTAQYIQVSSRIGRDPEKPGLVAMIYGPSKPRDRSHYERFRSYHQKLYAQVEPTSVTPFSPPAVERALHAVLVAIVRQMGKMNSESATPDPFPLPIGSPLRKLVEDTIGERVADVAPEEQTEVRRMLNRRLDEWKNWQPASYGGFGAPPPDPPLIHPAGSTEPPGWNGRSWPTMSSLRDVDASCEADVTDYFINDLVGEGT